MGEEGKDDISATISEWRNMYFCRLGWVLNFIFDEILFWKRNHIFKAHKNVWKPTNNHAMKNNDIGFLWLFIILLYVIFQICNNISALSATSFWHFWGALCYICGLKTDVMYHKYDYSPVYRVGKLLILKGFTK